MIREHVAAPPCAPCAQSPGAPLRGLGATEPTFQAAGGGFGTSALTVAGSALYAGAVGYVAAKSRGGAIRGGLVGVAVSAGTRGAVSIISKQWVPAGVLLLVSALSVSGVYFGRRL